MKNDYISIPESTEPPTFHGPAFPAPLERRLAAIEQFGDAILRWIVTLTLTLCVAAVSAAYVAQYLAGK